jgi:hypothetical protein
MKDQLYNFDCININNWNLQKDGFTIISQLLHSDDPNYTNQRHFTIDRKKAIDSYIRRPESQLHLVFLQQLTRDNGSMLFEWKQVKLTLGNSSKGPTLLFFKFIAELLCDSLHTHPRLTNTRYQQQHTNRYTPIKPSHPSSDGRQKEWVIVKHKGKIHYGKIHKKTSNGNFIYQHWINQDHSDLLVECQGCEIKNTSNVTDQTQAAPCLKKGLHKHASTIKVQPLNPPIDGAKY